MHRPIVDLDLAVSAARRPCASSSWRRRAPGSPRARGRRGFPCGSRPRRWSPPPGRAGCRSSSVSTRSEFQISERSVTRTSAKRARVSSSSFAAFAERFAGAEHRRSRAASSSASRRGCARSAWRHWRGAGGRSAPAHGRRHRRQRLVRLARAHRLRRAIGGGAAEHDEVEQRVRAEPVGAVHRHAGRLADRHQARAPRVRVAVRRA